MARPKLLTLALGLVALGTGVAVAFYALLLGYTIEASPAGMANSATGHQIAVPAVVAIIAGIVALAGWRRTWGLVVGCVGVAAAVAAVLVVRVHGVTWRSYGVGVPPLALALVGLVHPMVLTPDTSRQWTTLHVALIPVFPLLGGCLWLLLRRESGLLPVVARVAAFVYACFYTALDAVNGVAVGMFVRQAPPAQAASQAEALRPVLNLGNALGWVGSGAFLLAAGLTGAVVVRRHGRRAVLGAVLTVMASVSFLDSHIYWPRGVITMVVLATGLVLLARELDRTTLDE